MTIQDYLTAFDGWLSQHIEVSLKSGKDLAFKDRRINCNLKLDHDGAAWDYLLIEPGSMPPAGYAWTVYRLHGVAPCNSPAAAPPPPAARRRRRVLIAGLAQAVFGHGRVPAAETAVAAHTLN